MIYGEYISIALWILYLLLFSYIVVSKTNVVDTSETDTQIALLLLLGTMIVVAPLLLFINLIYNFIFEYIDQLGARYTLLSLICYFTSYAIILIYPTVSVFLSFFIAESIYKKQYKVHEPSKSNPDYTNLNSYVNELSNSLSIKQNISVKFSSFGNMSPKIYAATPKKCFLIFPNAFLATIDSKLKRFVSSSDIEKDKRLVSKYIILHELSHVLNKDIFLFSYLTIFVKLIKYFWIFLTFAVLLYYFALRSFLQLTHYDLVKLYIPFVLISLLIYISYRILVNKRELLADARAAIYFTDDEIARLTNKSILIGRTKFSLVEIVLASFTNVQVKRSFYAAINKYYNKFKSIFRVSQFLNVLYKPLNLRERLDYFRERKLYSETRSHPSKDLVIWLGVELSVFLTLLFSLYRTFGDYLPTYGNIVDVKLAFFMSFAWFVILANSFIFALPVSNLSNNSKFNISFYKKAFLDFLVMLLSFVVATAIIALLIIPLKLLPYYKSLDFMLNGYLLCSLAVFPFFLIFTLLKYGMPDNSSKFTKYDVEFIATAILVLGGLLVVVVPIFNAIIIRLESINIFLFLILWSLLFLKINSNVVIFSSEKDIISIKVVKTYYLELGNSTILKRFITYSLLAIKFALIVYVIPLFLFYIIASNIYSSFSVRFLTNTDLLSAILIMLLLAYALIELRKKTGNKSISQIDWLEFNIKIAKYCACSLKASTSDQIRNVALNNIFGLKDISLLSNNMAKNKIEKGLLSIKSIYTFNNIVQSVNSEMPISISKLACLYENTYGGFGFFSETPSRIEATYYGLSILFSDEHKKGVDISYHIQWLMNCFDDGMFRDTKTKLLTNTCFALKSLVMLEESSWLDKHNAVIGNAIIDAWQNSKRNVSDTWYVLKSLELLKYQDIHLLETIKKYWVPIYINTVLNKRIDYQYKDIAYFIEIIKMLEVTNTYFMTKLKETFLQSYFFKTWFSK